MGTLDRRETRILEKGAWATPIVFQRTTWLTLMTKKMEGLFSSIGGRSILVVCENVCTLLRNIPTKKKKIFTFFLLCLSCLLNGYLSASDITPKSLKTIPGISTFSLLFSLYSHVLPFKLKINKSHKKASIIS